MSIFECKMKEMKSIKLLYILSMVAMLGSCTESVKESPKVIYPEASAEQTKTSIVEESEQIKVADLPIVFPGTDYLLFPLGDVRVYTSGSKYAGSRTKEVSYTISNYNHPEITGYISNVKFQHKDSLNFNSLTEENIQIQSITYLDKLTSETNEKILVYVLYDKDTNKDSICDEKDIKSLYLSQINGINFKKVTEEYHELVDWKYIKETHKLYFRTVEDINKNGAFDNHDKVHYYYIDLLDKKWESKEYEPIVIEQNN